jgi:hypothetical protein
VHAPQANDNRSPAVARRPQTVPALPTAPTALEIKANQGRRGRGVLADFRSRRSIHVRSCGLARLRLTTTCHSSGPFIERLIVIDVGAWLSACQGRRVLTRAPVAIGRFRRDEHSSRHSKASRSDEVAPAGLRSRGTPSLVFHPHPQVSVRFGVLLMYRSQPIVVSREKSQSCGQVNAPRTPYWAAPGRPTPPVLSQRTDEIAKWQGVCATSCAARCETIPRHAFWRTAPALPTSATGLATSSGSRRRLAESARRIESLSAGVPCAAAPEQC